MKKKVLIPLLIILVLIVVLTLIINLNEDNRELKTIKSEKQLSQIYEGKEYSESKNVFINIISMPFSAIFDNWNNRRYYIDYDLPDTLQFNSAIKGATNSDSLEVQTEPSNTKDYSTTNIQVENVDEADIIKTDGDYIYSISDNNVIITDVRNTEKMCIAAKIEVMTDCIPEELIIYKNKLAIISSKVSSSYSYYVNKNNTFVEIYDITDKTNPTLLKDYELLEPYYTSRCIDNELYIIASGNLRKENDKVVTYYKENSVVKNISFDSIKYLNDVNTKKQTLISTVDLNNIKDDVKIQSYLIDISNAYVSENAIYLSNERYEYDRNIPPISSIFGLKGIIGAFSFEQEDNSFGYNTEIYKFDIQKSGNIEYSSKSKTKGRSINQYSFDEKNGHLRMALYDNEGTRVIIFNENLKEIGRTENIAQGEKMYSSRFMGDKVYLVTYKTIDPLFVIDLSNEEKPTVLGKLKIPGYSTYLHPYDENHIIGIGMETEEIVNRNSSGRVISTTAKIKGMKMALFDVSNVETPKQISNTIIGDSRTSSAILTNPKALLFSKEKSLIAIPVNNYTEDFEIEENASEYDEIINSYKKYNKDYIAEGYFVYKINIQDGFNLKGVITHEKQKNKGYYYLNSKLLRGLYIDNNLYTISEEMIKVNKLDTLEQIKEIKIK